MACRSQNTTFFEALQQPCHRARKNRNEMRGVAPGMAEIRRKEANERIRFIRKEFGIKRGDGGHVRFFDVSFFDGQGPYWVYQLYNDHYQCM